MLTFFFLELNKIVFLSFSFFFFLLLILVADSFGVFSCAPLGIKSLAFIIAVNGAFRIIKG